MVGAGGRTGSPGAAGRLLMVAALAFVAGLLAAELVLSPSPAAGQAASAGQGGVFAIAGQITRETYGLYLVDLQNATICVYQYLPNDRVLRLMAARTYVHDRRLDAYNTDPPPEDIAKLVAEARRLKDTTTKP